MQFDADAAERVAQEFHTTYERLAPDHGYETRQASAVPWPEVPERNRRLMIAVVTDLLGRGVITVPSESSPSSSGVTITMGPPEPDVRFVPVPIVGPLRGS